VTREIGWRDHIQKTMFAVLYLDSFWWVKSFDGHVVVIRTSNNNYIVRKNRWHSPQMIGYCVLLDKIDYLADIGNEVWTLIGVNYEKTILSTHFCLFKWFYSVHTGASRTIVIIFASPISTNVIVISVFSQLHQIYVPINLELSKLRIYC
jgi:hypothetical protein